MVRNDEEAKRVQRRNTLVGYLIISAVVGLDYTYMLTTLYLYLRDMVKVEKPCIYYGLIVASYIISSTLFGALSGKWVEKTRMMKAYINLIIIVQIVGCLLYVCHFHLFFAWIGRFIAGIGQPFPSVATGEIIRIFDKEESTRALWWLASVYTIGGMVGPIIVLLFQNVDCYIDKLHITQLNAVSIFMAIVLMITLVIVEFLIHDYSRESSSSSGVGSRSERSRRETSRATETRSDSSEDDYGRNTYDTELETEDESTDHVEVSVVLKGLLTSSNAVLMFVSTLWFMYNLFSTLILLPLIVLIILKWNLSALAVVIITDGLLYFFLLMLMSKYCTTDKAVYAMTIISILAQICMLCVIISMKLLPRNLSRDIMLMVLLLLFGAFGWFIEEVLLSWMLVQMVPANCQSFTNSLRNGVSRFSEIAAAVSAPVILPTIQYWAYSLGTIVFLLLLIFLAKRKSLMNIKTIAFDSYQLVDGSRR